MTNNPYQTEADRLIDDHLADIANAAAHALDGGGVEADCWVDYDPHTETYRLACSLSYRSDDAFTDPSDCLTFGGIDLKAAGIRLHGAGK